MLPEDRPEFSNLLETINFLLEKSTSEDANYVLAGEEEEEEVKPVTGAMRKKSLIYKLDFVSWRSLNRSFFTCRERHQAGRDGVGGGEWRCMCVWVSSLLQSWR